MKRRYGKGLKSKPSASSAFSADLFVELAAVLGGSASPALCADRLVEVLAVPVLSRAGGLFSSFHASWVFYFSHDLTRI